MKVRLSDWMVANKILFFEIKYFLFYVIKSMSSQYCNTKYMFDLVETMNIFTFVSLLNPTPQYFQWGFEVIPTFHFGMATILKFSS